MRYGDFEDLIERLTAELPEEFLDGVAEVAVSRRTVPHPTRADIFTMGECIPLPVGERSDSGIQSRIVLYHGSFQALAELHGDFDWREEAWETLTHELRHHLEWRANAPDLEAFDSAAEENFARRDGEPFDPLFFLDGEPVAEGVYRIDDDYFIDRVVDRLEAVKAAPVELSWHGRTYQVTAPPELTLPAHLLVSGVEDPPPGDLVLVLRKRQGGVRDLLRRPQAFQAEVAARPVGS